MGKNADFFARRRRESGFALFYLFFPVLGYFEQIEI